MFSWWLFAAIVGVMLGLDLFVFQRKAHEPKLVEAALWSALWILLAILFGGHILVTRGAEPALQYGTAWILEKALSVDNLFVFMIAFGSFAVPAKLRHRVLFWGVIGALVSRMVFIFAGIELIEHFHWAIYLFGLILVVTAIRIFLKAGSEEASPDLEQNVIMRIARRVLPVSRAHSNDGKFFVRENGRLLATPLLLVLISIEAADILFALDSIPAVFGVTTDRFLVYTSNIFAILGLRSLYFLVAGVLAKLEGLGTGLALVLGFVGAKMLGSGLVHVPTPHSLGIIVILLSTPMFVAFLLRHGARKVLILIAGLLVLGIGIALIVLPGPAVLVIPLGLAILGSEFEWARNLSQALRRRVGALTGRL